MRYRSFPRRTLPALRLASPGVATALILSLAGCGRRRRPRRPRPTCSSPRSCSRMSRSRRIGSPPWRALWMRRSAPRSPAYLPKQDYQEGGFVHQRRPALRDRPPPVRCGAGPGRGRSWPRPRPRSARPSRTSAATARSPRSRPSASRNWTTPCRPTSPPSAQVAAAAGGGQQAQLNLDFTRIISPIDGIAGIVSGADRRSGRPGHRGPDDGLHDGPDQGVFPDQRADLPRFQRAIPGAAGLPAGSAARPDPLGWQRLSVPGEVFCGGPPDRPRTPARCASRRSFPIPDACSARASTAGCARSCGRSGRPAGAPEGRSPNCRAATRWRPSTRDNLAHLARVKVGARWAA